MPKLLSGGEGAYTFPLQDVSPKMQPDKRQKKSDEGHTMRPLLIKNIVPNGYVVWIQPYKRKKYVYLSIIS